MKTNGDTLIILSPGFPKDEADTSCLTSQQNLVRAFNKKFPAIQIIIISFQYPFTRSTYTWFGNKVIAFNGKNKGNIFRLLLWKKILKELQGINSRNKLIGLLSFWCGECALIGNRFSVKYGLEHYCWILGQDAKKDNNYVKRIKPSPRELVAMSDFLADEFLMSHDIRPGTIIPNGIDPGLFQKTNAGRNIDIIGVGSLIPLKQYDVFIEVIKEMKKYFPGIRVLLCGTGPEEKKLKALIDKYELNDNISIAGELTHENALLLMQQSKILVHPSVYEGFSTVSLEALYAGCHVVSFVKPMKNDIEHWHIVKTKEEMLQKCIALLGDNAIDHSSISPYLIEDSATAIMKLFG